MQPESSFAVLVDFVSLSCCFIQEDNVLAFHIKTVPFEVSALLYELFADIINSIYNTFQLY